MTEIERIIDQLNRAFVGEAWHGPGVIEILDGVKPGETVAVTNLSQLFNGAPITLVNGSAPAPKTPPAR